MTSSPAPVLSARGLGVRAADRVLVHPFDLDLHPGRTVALVGESGSGKTSSALALLGETLPGVTVDGSVDLAVRPAFLPQSPAAALTPARRVGAVMDEVAAGALPRSRRRDRELRATMVARAAHRARFEESLLRRFPHELSGGQQQRAVLAQLLVPDPGVLIADEPTTGQDPVMRTELVAELRRLVGDGVALLLLSHDLEAVRSLADHVVVLDQRRVVEQGPRLWENGTHPITRRLFTATGSTLRPPSPRQLDADVPSPALRLRGVCAHHRATRTTVLHDVDLGRRPDRH